MVDSATIRTLESMLAVAGIEVRAGGPAADVVDGVVPCLVAVPRTREQVAQALCIASEAGAAVVPRGAGTKMHFGNPPRTAEVILELSSLRGVVEYEPADLTITAQAGIPMAELQRVLGQSGQFLPLDPPYADRGTLGGTLATNVSGPSRLLYGTARDLVLGTRWATPAGELVKAGGKVVKNVVGYDLNKMHIGALGTVGVLVEASLKVYPLPQAEATVWSRFDDLAAAQSAAGRIARSVLYPRAVELLDADALTRATQGLEAQGFRLHLEGPPQSDPELGTSSLQRRPYGVLVWCSGSVATVERQARDAETWCREAGAAASGRVDGEAHGALWPRISDFGRDLPAGACLVKVATLPTQVSDIVVRASASAVEVGLCLAVLTHAGSGITYAAISPAEGVGQGAQEGASERAIGDTEARTKSEDASSVDRLERFVRTLTDSAVGLGGSAVVEWCPLALKARLDVWGPTRDDFPLMRALKDQFDPGHALNPGRFVGGI